MVVVEEFQQQVYNQIAQAGVNVSVRPVTRTFSNITGDEVITSGAAVTHKVLFGGPMWRTVLDKEGKFVDADGFIVANGSVSFNKLDLITYAGSVYEVRMTESRRWRGSGAFTYAVLYSRV